MSGTATPLAAHVLPRLAVRDGVAAAGTRTVPEEVAVALVYDGTTHAVLMATPADLEDLGRGFSLTEGIVVDALDILGLEIVPEQNGIEVRMWLASGAGQALATRRRALVGATGCGLCGVESLAEAVRIPPRMADTPKFDAAEISDAVAALHLHQPLGDATRAVHAAGWWLPGAGMVAVREDVGRHNALDKLAGVLAAASYAGGDGIVVLTSRVSVEMIQKAAMIGAPIVAAVSAPTALAVRTAEAAGMTLVAVARDDGFEVFCGGERIGIA